MKSIVSIGFGFLFGGILIASEAFQWARIQQMFHFESFHMFGLLFSAILTAFLSVILIKKWKIKSIKGNEIAPKEKEVTLFGNTFGGLIFGAGWALTGACTAPLFILVGAKWPIGVITLLGALAGVTIYGLIKKWLPV